MSESERERWSAAAVGAVKVMRRAVRPRLRQRELAKRLGMSFWEYYNLERGHSKIGAAELFMIARACGCRYPVMCKEVLRLIRDPRYARWPGLGFFRSPGRRWLVALEREPLEG